MKVNIKSLTVLTLKIGLLWTPKNHAKKGGWGWLMGGVECGTVSGPGAIIF